jgi:pimeloyl-ACP methyl ester carboxylesterase
MPAPSKGPDTIVLVHGFWVTPRSWENWITRYEAKGYRVLAPAYPGLEVEVEALNRDPSPIERLTVPAIMEKLESVVGGLEEPPIIMGHSAGGAFTQLLLDRGYGAVGVVMDSAPTEGVLVAPLSQLKASFPVLKNPANRHKAVGLTYEQWRYTFTNTWDEADARAAYERYHVPASGGIFWDSVLANFIPGPQEISVDYNNDARAPLLFISGGEDHLMPPAVQRSNLKHYKSNTITEIKEFEGRSHLMPAQKGWEEVADYALSWAVENATRRPQMTTARRADSVYDAPLSAPGAEAVQ